MLTPPLPLTLQYLALHHPDLSTDQDDVCALLDSFSAPVIGDAMRLQRFAEIEAAVTALRAAREVRRQRG